MDKSAESCRQDKYRTSTGQAQDKLRTSSGQARYFEDIGPDILRMLEIVGEDRLSAKEIMERLKLKGRDNFLNLYLSPAMKAGLVASLYPDKPRHPRQKYMLTWKGLEIIR